MTTRRHILSGLAALAAPAASLPAFAAEPDPIFALIDAERVARKAHEDAMDAEEAAEAAFDATGLNRKP